MNKIFRKIGAVATMWTVCVAASAQAKLVLDTPVNHVGEVVFQTPKQIVFTFQNKGNEPLEVKNVIPSCGCTQADWTRGPIAPGERGQITAVYDAGMLGTFSKDLAVYTNVDKKPIYVQMEGRVVTEKLDFTGDFPIDLGNVRINTNYLEFDNVNRGDHPVAELQIFNQERSPYRPELMHLPNYLNARAVPEVIAGGRMGRVLVTLDSEKLGLLGLNQTRIFLSRFMGDKVSEQNEILVSSVLLPDFSNMTAEELAVAPKMQLSHEEVQIEMLGKQKQTQVVTITNGGQTPLNIRSVQVFNQAISVNLSDRTIAPGKTAQLKLTVNAKYLKKAKNRPRVLLITNDPQKAKQTINVSVVEN